MSCTSTASVFAMFAGLVVLGAMPGCGGRAVGESNDAQCGPACSGACASGRCLTTLAYGRVASLDNRMALSDSTLYWTDSSNGDGNPTSYVRRVPVVGGDASVLASGVGIYLGIAVDAESVYWDGYGGGTILKAPIAGGMLTTLAAELNEPYRIAVSDGEVYWTDLLAQTVMTVPTTGGKAIVLATLGAGLFPHGIAVDETSVYWAAFNYTCSPGGYECVAPPHLGEIMKVARTGGVPVTLAMDQSGPDSMALDSASVYWVNYAGREVMKVSKDGGMPVTLASSPLAPTDIAVDSSYVYWTAPDYPGSGAVMKVSVGGGAPQTLVSQQVPACIVVDATSIYWLDVSGPRDQVMRLTPK